MNRHSHQTQSNAGIKFMMVIALGIFALDLSFSLSSRIWDTPILDRAPFMAGRWVGSAHFFLVYQILLLRVLCRQFQSLNFLCMLSILFLIVIGFLGALYGAKIYHQDQIMLFNIEFTGIQFRQFARGAATIIPVIATIMILTPVVIPSSQIQLITKLFDSRPSTGIGHMDSFLDARKKRQTNPNIDIDHGPEILLVEDDLASAALVMKFCKKLKLECRHFESLEPAIACFEEFQKHWKVLILDNFVRVDENGQEHLPKTGAEWAKALNHIFPKSERRFQIALLTGHSHLVEDITDEVDLVLQKPWDPKELFLFLKEKEVV